MLADPEASAAFPRPARALSCSPTMRRARCSISRSSIAPGQFHYLQLLNEARVRFARARLARHGRRAGRPASGMSGAFAAVADKIFLMAYDEHSNDGPPGPIASQQWWASDGRRRRAPGPARQDHRHDRQLCLRLARRHRRSGQRRRGLGRRRATAMLRPIGTASRGNSTFAYEDENGHPHTVWLLDAASAFNELTLLDRAGIREVALVASRRGRPGHLVDLRAHASGSARRGRPHPPRPTAPTSTSRGRARSCGSPRFRRRESDGSPSPRTACSPTSNSCRVPRPYTITRTGWRPGLVALTFDDGPDARWTPQILDILKQKQVPATFFIVGENALTERGLLERMIREGHEVGSHTYTHPNIATIEQDPDAVRAERDTAAVPGLHRAHAQAVPRALFRRRRADHGR